MFPLRWIENKWLVNYGDFTSDGRSIHGTISHYRCSKNEYGLLEVIDDTFMAMELKLFIWLALISLIVFSNVVSGSNVAASKLLFILTGSKFSSKYVIANILMAAETILFRWLSSISLRLYLVYLTVF